MVLVKLRGLLARRRALARVVGAGEKPAPDIARGGLDRAAELGGTRETGVGGRRSVLAVAVGAGDHDVEVVLVLAGLGRHGVGDGGAPEGALVVYG